MTTPDARIEALERELAAALEENERLRLMLPVVGATVMPPGAHEKLVAELAAARALLEDFEPVIRGSITRGWDCHHCGAEAPRSIDGLYHLKAVAHDAGCPAVTFAAFLAQPPSVSGGARELEVSNDGVHWIPMRGLLTAGQWPHARWVLVPSVSGGVAPVGEWEGVRIFAETPPGARFVCAECERLKHLTPGEEFYVRAGEGFAHGECSMCKRHRTGLMRPAPTPAAAPPQDPRVMAASLGWCRECGAKAGRACTLFGGGVLREPHAGRPAAAPETAPERCKQCDEVLTLSCPGGCELPERCESGCEGPVAHHDVDGVPLCESCWDELAKDAPINPDGHVSSRVTLPTPAPVAPVVVREPQARWPPKKGDRVRYPHGDVNVFTGRPLADGYEVVDGATGVPLGIVMKSAVDGGAFTLLGPEPASPSGTPNPGKCPSCGDVRTYLTTTGRVACLACSLIRPEPATPPTPEPGVSGAREGCSLVSYSGPCPKGACPLCDQQRAVHVAPPPVQPPGDGERMTANLRAVDPSDIAKLGTACDELEARFERALAEDAVRVRAEALREAIAEVEAQERGYGSGGQQGKNIRYGMILSARALRRLASAVPGTPGETK